MPNPHLGASPHPLEVVAFSRAVEETARRARNATARRTLFGRVCGAAGWLAFALGSRAFGGRPSVAASAPAAAAYLALALAAAVVLWKSSALLRAWLALPLLDVPALAAIAWPIIPLAAGPVGAASMVVGLLFVVLSGSQRSLSAAVVCVTAGAAVVAGSALLWHAGLPQAAPVVAVLFGFAAWPLIQGPRQARGFFERLVREHGSLQRFGRFYSPVVVQKSPAETPGASANDVQVTLLFAELHLPSGPDPFQGSADLEEAIASFDAAVAQQILHHGGTIDHAAGAGLVLYFLRTAALGEDGERGVRCALEMAAALDAFNHRREVEGRPPVALGLGVHSGWAAIDRSAGLGEMIVLGNAVGTAAVLARRSWSSRMPVLASPEARVRAAGGFTWAAAGDDAFVVGIDPRGGGPRQIAG